MLFRASFCLLSINSTLFPHNVLFYCRYFTPWNLYHVKANSFMAKAKRNDHYFIIIVIRLYFLTNGVFLDWSHPGLPRAMRQIVWHCLRIALKDGIRFVSHKQVTFKSYKEYTKLKNLWPLNVWQMIIWNFHENKLKKKHVTGKIERGSWK